jgi:hypothetical protein
MTLQPRPASEAASCDPYAVAARDPAARSCPWDGRSKGCGRPHGSCAVTAIRVCPEATILSRSVGEAQYPHARVAAVRRASWLLTAPPITQADLGDPGA